MSRTPRAVLASKAVLSRTRSLRWAVRAAAPPGGLRILLYHRVSDDRDDLAVTPARFAEQMEALAREGYRTVGVARALAGQASASRGERLVALSFDDGFRDVAENALPVLERLGFAATVFVSTAVVDGTASFDWYERQPPLLSWADIGALDRGPELGFEAHTLSHPNLLALQESDARAEIVRSRETLERRLGRPVTGFAYPAGLYGPRERLMVRDAGFGWAVSCEPGTNAVGGDPFTLRRTQVDGRDRLVDFRAKLGGAHDSPLPLRTQWRRLRYGPADAPATAGAPRGAGSGRPRSRRSRA
jgi:peptidoglycan/xylan/chitin deacetylase (PgdA/CDA1 family)